MRIVEYKRALGVRSKQAIAAFLQADLLSEWWGVERCLIDPREGGLYLLSWKVSENGFSYVTTGIIRQLNHDLLHIHQMAYLNPAFPILGPMSLKIEATETEKGCDLLVRQEGYQTGAAWDWYYKAVLDAWPVALEALGNCLEAIDP